MPASVGPQTLAGSPAFLTGRPNGKVASMPIAEPRRMVAGSDASAFRERFAHRSPTWRVTLEGEG